jgi:2-dehydropantoate 2-reductase
MKTSVFGAGAIGGYIAAKLAGAGHDVSIVARGAHLDAIRQRGLRLESRGETQTFPVRATDRAEELGPQDLVVLTVKAHAMPGAASAIASLMGPETVLVPAQNGIPWWFTYRMGGTFEGVRVAAADPDGSVSRFLAPSHVIGCVVYMAIAVPEPGLIRRFGGNLLILGEPSGEATPRLAATTAAFTGAGIKIETTPRIRDALWMKLWGNIAFNPLSVLTGATMGRMAEDLGVRAVLRAAMMEMKAVAEKLGTDFNRDVEHRIDEGRLVGDFKTSMLQDFEAGRPVEIDALVGAVIELGERVGVATPMLAAIHALTRMRAEVKSV